MQSSTPTNNPYSTSKNITMTKVTAQMAASVLSSLQNLRNSVTFISIPFNATTIMLARTHCVANAFKFLAIRFYVKEGGDKEE